MRRTVFYSWQSDLPAGLNRNLIENCLSRAIRSIGRDADAKIEPVLDRDTANLAGAPDVAHSILAKIAVADAFVADVSIVNAGAARPMPNPNVLVELGYAVAQLGWDHIILIQNSAFGGPELLPFDLRGRRTVVYEANEASNRAEVRGLLQGRLEVGLRTALSEGSTGILPSGTKGNLWFGDWTFNLGSAGGTLSIRDVGPSGFLFDLSVVHGAHSGAMTAYGRIMSENAAYCRSANGAAEQEGELIFRRSLDRGQRIIEIDEASSFSAFHGARASFGGTFTREREPWFDAGFMNEIEVARLYRLLGKQISKMRDCTSDIGESESLDEEVSARVVAGGVAGLYTFLESIVMFNDATEMWAAYIDDDTVKYFTNSPRYKASLPKTIEEWRSRFSDKRVEHCESGIVHPKHIW